MPDGGATPERRAAFRVLRRVAEGAYADRALAAEAEREGLDSRARGQAHRLAFGTVQRRRTLDWLIDGYIDRPDALEPPVRDAMRLGAFELAYSDGVPARTAVDQAVRIARGLPGAPKRAAGRGGVVNAVLRRLAAEVDTRLAQLSDETPAAAAVMHSVPDWIAERLFEGLGPEQARGTLAAANVPAESALRWNPLRGSREELGALLPSHARRDEVIEGAYVVDGRFALEESPVWERGLAIGQSRASMLPPLVLDPKAGERILDLCAAPGAKATQIAALTANGAEIVCVEMRPARAAALRALATRLGARLTVVEGDGRTVPVPGPFDGVLVDPPCTGLGVLAARPDSRWRRQESDLAGLRQLQSELLARAIAEVRPGGRVVYSTCTLLPEENEGQVEATGLPIRDLGECFPTLRHPRLAGALLTLPDRDGTDGFFVARLECPNGSWSDS